MVAVASLDDVCASVEISGPGFINLTLSEEFVTDQIAAAGADERVGVALTDDPQRIVIDYSAPNVAKEMHVGHLRSTVIGDALARVLGFLGHEVLRENHIGDWGTPFGMLIEHLVDLGGSAKAESFSVRDLNEFYAQARREFDTDPDFAERSSRRVVLLQSGDPETLRLWQHLRGREPAPQRRDLLHAGRAADRRRRGGGELLQRRCCRWWSRSWRRRGSWWSTTARSACSPKGSRTATVTPCP